MNYVFADRAQSTGFRRRVRLMSGCAYSGERYVQPRQVQPLRKQKTNSVLAPSGTDRSAYGFTYGQTWQITTVRFGCATHIKIHSTTT